MIASATEIICALGCRDLLVGRSHECDYPPGILQLPRCTRPRFQTDGTSSEIDRQVRETLARSPADAVSIYEVDAGLLASLRPDVILTQSQCEVCAVSLSDVERAVCEWTRISSKIVSLEPNRLDDLWTDIRSVSKSLGVADRGEQLVAGLRSRMRRICGATPHTVPEQSLLCIEWMDPLMTAANWMPDLIRVAGGKPLPDESGRRSMRTDWKDLIHMDPDVILVAPCGFSLERTLKEVHLLTGHSDWKSLKAVRGRRVYAGDGNQFFHRPGPRLCESAEILAEILHPETLHYGHEGTGWVRVEA